MKKVIFTLSFIGLGLVSVSCSTDAYDLPDTNELKVQKSEAQIYLEVQEEVTADFEETISVAKEGDSDSTDPVVSGSKKD